MHNYITYADFGSRAASNRLTYRVKGSNPAKGMNVRGFFVCCAGSGLCDEPIIRPDKFYGVCCLFVDYVI
jgi:hypothetical protein